MATTSIDAGRRVFANLKYLYFTPWTSESDPTGTTYDLVNIVGDTTSLEQAENEVNALEHEFSNEPLYENITLGEKTFTTECIDFQDTVLKELFGWEADDAGNQFAPTVYKDLYVTIEMGFNSTNDVIVLPKVKLNSRAVIASMKTDASRGNITGTCYSAWVNGKNETDMAVIKADAQGAVPEYTIAAEKTGA